MNKSNRVFIATSLDGYIADRNGQIDWLHSIPNPDGDDMGYNEFISDIDALVMGRVTFETVCGFDIPWPYEKPVFVLSNSLNEIPESLKKKVFLVKGTLDEILDQINDKGYHKLYIDGGNTIHSFLKEDLIDELVLTTIPILLGGGSPLFQQLPTELGFQLVNSKVFLGQVVQSRFRRKKEK